MSDEEKTHTQTDINNATARGFLEAHSNLAYVGATEASELTPKGSIAYFISDMLREHNLEEPAELHCILAHAVNVGVPGALELFEKTFGPLPTSDDVEPDPDPSRQAN